MHSHRAVPTAPWQMTPRRAATPAGRGRARAVGAAAAARAAVAPRGHRALRVRRPDRVPRAAAGRRAARDRGPGRRRAAHLPPARRCRWSRAAPAPACRAARCRTALGVTLSLAKFNRILKIDPLARTARRAMRRAQPRDQRGGRAARPVLRARPEQPDRLHDRRQRGRELGRRALPEVRPDAAQRAARARLHRSKASRSSSAATRSTRPGSTCSPLVVGSEGMLAVIDRGDGEAACPKPQLARCIMASFDDIRKAGDAVAAIIARRHHPGRPRDDGQADDRRGRGLRARRLRPRRRGDPAVRERRHARRGRGRDRAHGGRCCAASGATRIEVSDDEAQRLRFWSGRKNAFPASGRISPDYMCMDSTIPRKRLADILLRDRRDGEDLRPALRQRVPRRRRQPAPADPVRRQRRRPAAPRRGVRRRHPRDRASRLGGTVTGEHGVGVEKLGSMCVQFSPDEREQMLALKRAFDPRGPAQPGQGDPDAAALRRGRQDARAARPAAVRRPAAVLMQRQDAMRRRARSDSIERVRAAQPRGAPLEHPRRRHARTSTARRRRASRST